MFESFYRTHSYLITHLGNYVKRELMNQIDWSDRLIGIKGSRGVGKTTFLLTYAKEHFGEDKACLYINLNNFFFTTHTLVEFAGMFAKQGGKVLLLDQIFKYPNWSKELRVCYDSYPDLKIIFTGSPVIRLKQENPDLDGKATSYFLKGFSFREFINLKTNNRFPSYSLKEILKNHRTIASTIIRQLDPSDYFEEYLHHGYYPFFLEKRNYSENLLKTVNMMLEVDILLIYQIEQKYLHKIKKLLYLLAQNAPSSPNVSQLSQEIQISRATVMNYIKYLKEARVINLIYNNQQDTFPKKPSKVYLHNTNLIYALTNNQNHQSRAETFFINTLYNEHRIWKGDSKNSFSVDNNYIFKFSSTKFKQIDNPNMYFINKQNIIGKDHQIPLWLFGFLY